MLLEKYEDFLELSTFSWILFPYVRQQVVCENKCWCCYSCYRQLFFVYSKSYSDPSVIQFHSKGNIKSKSTFKRVLQVVSSYLFQENCIKNENIVSSRLSFQNGVI